MTEHHMPNWERVYIIILLVGCLLVLPIIMVHAEPLDCTWFWDYPQTGYYIVSEIDGEHEIRYDLWILRTLCST